ncbi:MAG: hypothetical protein ACE5Q6_09995 [Dehalococcoidia bacterium]
MEQVDLSRYEVTGILGTGADYEVRAATDRQTQQSVVLKRPVPQMISRQMHGAVETRTDRTLQVYGEVGQNIELVSPILGYTERANHDQFFGESLGQEYRIMVEERASGIPLVGDPRSRILRVPIGVGQHLFALFPVLSPEGRDPFHIQQQLLDVQEGFLKGGFVLLDLGPQNIFYQPGTGKITVIDSGALLTPENDRVSGGRGPQDIHDFYLEVIKFYTTPLEPPLQVAEYRDPYGMRPAITFEQELDEQARDFGARSDPARNAALYLIAKVRDRAYQDFSDFRQDLTAYLEEVRIRNQKLPALEESRQAWHEALDLLRADHWRRYLFDPDSDLTVFENAD